MPRRVDYLLKIKSETPRTNACEHVPHNQAEYETSHTLTVGTSANSQSTARFDAPLEKDRPSLLFARPLRQGLAPSRSRPLGRAFGPPRSARRKASGPTRIPACPPSREALPRFGGHTGIRLPARIFGARRQSGAAFRRALGRTARLGARPTQPCFARDSDGRPHGTSDQQKIVL
jgi:hypothetical protein